MGVRVRRVERRPRAGVHVFHRHGSDPVVVGVNGHGARVQENAQQPARPAAQPTPQPAKQPAAAPAAAPQAQQAPKQEQPEDDEFLKNINEIFRLDN